MSKRTLEADQTSESAAHAPHAPQAPHEGGVTKRPRGADDPASPSHGVTLVALPEELLVLIVGCVSGGELILVALVCRLMAVLCARRLPSQSETTPYERANTYYTSRPEMWRSRKLFLWASCLGLHCWHQKSAEIASKRGHLDTLKALHERCYFDGSLIKHSILLGAAEGGHLQIVSWAFSSFYTYARRRSTCVATIATAARHGALNIVTFVYEHSTCTYESKDLKRIFDAALRGGNRKVLEWCIDEARLCFNFGNPRWMLCEDNFAATCASLCAGHADLSTLKWVVQRFCRPYPDLFVEAQHLVYQRASLLAGNDERVQYLTSRNEYIALFVYTFDVFGDVLEDLTLACLHTTMRMADSMELRHGDERWHDTLTRIAPRAVKHGDRSVFRWLLQELKQSIFHVTRDTWLDVTRGAALVGDVDLLKEISAERPDCVLDAFPDSIRSGCLAAVQRVCALHDEYHRTAWTEPTDAPSAFRWHDLDKYGSACELAAACGHLPILEWLRSEDFSFCNTVLVACDRKKWRILSWVARHDCLGSQRNLLRKRLRDTEVEEAESDLPEAALPTREDTPWLYEWLAERSGEADERATEL